MKSISKHFTVENIAMIALFLFAIWCAVSAVSVLQKNYELLTRLREGEVTNQTLEIRNANLKLQQAYYKTDEFMELQAKAKLNKAVSGEHLVLLPKVKPAKAESEATATAARQLSNPQMWAQFLLGVRYD
ncbi:MAG: hypothetical protein LBK50_03935 [Candidatus Nomurabacteria bacterium]|jgi:cell division protein FtsL|nr:hypothetical protein [Candidatus Nomurabacteria bacterium]